MSEMNTNLPSTIDSRNTTKTLSDRIYQGLRQEILSCTLAPGETFFEGDVARRYHASKAPVREAVKRLMQEGLVQSIPGVGSAITPVTFRDVSDLFGYRRLLETATLQRAALVITDEQLSRLETLAGERLTLDVIDSHVRWHRSNVEFHVQIAAVAGNRRIERALRSVMEEMLRIEHMNLGKRRHTAEMVQEHLEIVAALRQHDPELAVVRAMRSIDGAVRLIQEYLRGN